ncbi:MAG TPA: Crp/Fnr family transcriptional regulator [Puia sp.]|jgi:CRP-like cAMP-binding protein|nr:Crp/Fnr family transcriptional regulator [Puia sp.]
MFELLHSKVAEKISITEAEFDLCKSLFTPKKLRKKQFLLQEGEVSRYTIFVTKGLLRSYTIDDKGVEHILQFALEGWWTADMYSFFTGEPSLFNIEALEDSEALLITRPSWESLLQQIPAFERYFRILIQNSLIATQRRLMETMSETAERKYLNFIKLYPASVQRVPQHMIASYLGITRETLSRLRRELAAGKSSA